MKVNKQDRLYQMSFNEVKFAKVMSSSNVSTEPTPGYHQQPQPPADLMVESMKEHNEKDSYRIEQPTLFKYRVGYWWSEKKSQKLNAYELSALFAERQCEFVKLDFEKHLDQQGPFDVIVHKISDILVKADQGDATAKKTISAFESYVRKHPQTVVLDPLDNNRALLDRYKQYRLIEQCELAKENVVFTPPFVHLTSTNIDVNRGRIRRSRITFPIVCKPILAQGSTGAHQMCIIFNEAGLKDVKPPCVAQSFVNHNARLFKLFVIKDKYYIMERPSLKNFHNVTTDQDTVFFYSHDISKPNSSSSLTELDEIDKRNLEDLMTKWQNGLQLVNNSQNGRAKPIMNDVISEGTTVKESGYPNVERKKLDDNNNKSTVSQEKETQQHDKNISQSSQQLSLLVPRNEILSKIVKIFSEKLGLTFYGIDIIIENETSRYAIIDMNTFPGYDGVENFLTIFRDIVCDAIPKETDQSQLQQTKLPAKKLTEHDSGIEST